MLRVPLFLAGIVLSFPAFPAMAADEPPDASTTAAQGGEVVFGQSAALTGPASELGTEMRLGLMSAFAEVNAKGGVHGRHLVLRSLDDAYEPEAAVANTRELIDEHDVFALVGAVGTPTSRAAQPVTSDAGVPYIAPFTGAEFLRDAEEQSNVVNVRASYFQETAEIVARLTQDLGITKIGILYQDDSYGRAGLAGVRRALDARGLPLVVEANYPRNTEIVKRALLDLRRFAPEAVVIIGAYQPAATLIRWARKVGFEPIFVNISFVGTSALVEELGADGAGVYITQVVPFPEDIRVPVVDHYQKALAASAPGAAPGFVSLEGYLAGRLVAEGLRIAGAGATREAFLDGLRHAPPIDLGGFELEYGMDDNQGSDRVYLTVIDANGDVVPAQRMVP
ncbi:MAG: ABC transporter substrate-binding protein [Gammaproteobacteria bacterium]|nr:ABC transporter substrate-binding protein [Gammaproteobacteria bacterium]